jgi:hypothetical protein
MALLGQASGGFTESSSALRLLYVGVRNSIGVLSDDAFTQTNPPVVTTASTISTNVDTQVFGVLSGSVAFTRPDQGSNVIGGPAESLADASLETFVRPLGLFINNAAGNAFENAPAAASGKGPYVSAQGSHGSQLFETQALGASTGGVALAQGDDLTYVAGQELVASRNGYLMPRTVPSGAATTSLDNAANASDVEHGLTASLTLGIMKMPADSVQAEIVFDQRV